MRLGVLAPYDDSYAGSTPARGGRRFSGRENAALEASRAAARPERKRANDGPGTESPRATGTTTTACLKKEIGSPETNASYSARRKDAPAGFPGEITNPFCFPKALPAGRRKTSPPPPRPERESDPSPPGGKAKTNNPVLHGLFIFWPRSIPFYPAIAGQSRARSGPQICPGRRAGILGRRNVATDRNR
jgi:hypothetical protein